MNIAILCFGIASISSVSGIEKVFVDMANQFAQKGDTVYSVWNDEPGIAPYYSFLPQVRQINLGLGKIKAPMRYKILREVAKGLHLNITNYVDKYKTERLCQSIRNKIDISDIDIVVCYEFNSVMVANKLFNGKMPIVAMCHNSIESQIATLTPLQRKEASKVTIYQVLMPSFVNKARKLIDTKICYIPNVVKPVPDNETADLAADKKIYKITMIGRIDKNQKRPLIAIKSFLEIASRFRNWELHFYGPITDQQYKKEIDEYIRVYDIHHQVIYKGITNNPMNILHNTDIFAFPSAYEGFGLSLTEANSMGVPAIGFATAPAVNEIIKNNITGFLVEDEKEFTEKLAMLMENKVLRTQMGKAAHRAMDEYSPNIVWGKWSQLLNKLVTENKKGR